jgi:hypothetical protein
LSGIAAITEFPERANNLLATPYKNPAGVIAFNVWVRGLPTILVVDDYVPVGNSGPAFAKLGTDGSTWVMSLEKAWAKLNGNYERIQSG